MICRFLFIFLMVQLMGCSDRRNTAIYQVQKGDSKSSVLKLLGDPDKTSSCSKNLWWEEEYVGEDVESVCVQTFWYGSLAFDRWSIGFDENDKVISKYHHVSG